MRMMMMMKKRRRCRSRSRIVSSHHGALLGGGVGGLSRLTCERVGKPLIGSNHMHSMARREGDETSLLVECNSAWVLTATIEG